MEDKPETMSTASPAGAGKRVSSRFSGEDLVHWAWTEPSVWKPTMLATLEKNEVRGGKWHSLMDKVYFQANLYSAYREVAANQGASGVDHVTIEDFTAGLHRNMTKLECQLRDGSYRPQAIRRVNIPKPGSTQSRPLGIPTVRDRVVQAALRHVLEPILERQFAEHSYGFRPTRGCKDALGRVDRLVKSGFKYTLDVDLKSYFDTIEHDRLIGELDHLMAKSGYQMTRYADDLVIQCTTREEAEAALAKVKAWTTERGLTLHPTKTKIVHVDEEGFELPGYRFIRHRRFPRKKSLMKFKDVIRGKTKRANGHSMQAIIANVNRTLRGWFEYFKHSWTTTFPQLDAWIRMRLRSILRKRAGRRGRARGLDHQRYPNTYFAELGLFNLTAAHVRECQSSRR